LLSLEIDLLLLLVLACLPVEDATDSTGQDRSQSRQESNPGMGPARPGEERQEPQGQGCEKGKCEHDPSLQIPEQRGLNLVGLTRVRVDDGLCPRTTTPARPGLVDLLLEVLVIGPVGSQQLLTLARSELTALNVLLLGRGQDVRESLRERPLGCRPCRRSLSGRDAASEQPPADGVIIDATDSLGPLALDGTPESIPRSVYEGPGCLTPEHLRQGIADLGLDGPRVRFGSAAPPVLLGGELLHLSL
jgi:hypothetical protein